ncbi:MAG: 4a-hydroxytetrahydrobiopterin dehydratase [Candidatus Wolfebacteria bacterium]|nr:4a-hydroxytetrahydrobiopterin dehydratase [Candidatus Wolfebacteria bacterium]
MKNLAQKTCVACEGGTPPLQGELLQKYLGQVDGWELIHGTKIKKEFSFKNFKEALVFVNKVGEVAEEEGHHPDIHLVSYKNVVIELWTHAIGGLSENDFIVAAKIEKLLH